MSTGVPNTVVVLKKASMPASVINRNGTTNAAAIHLVATSSGAGIVAQFAQQPDQRRIAAHLDLMTETCQQMRAPLREVRGARRQSLPDAARDAAR